MTQLRQSEAQIKRAVMDLLKARGVLCFRMNAGDRYVPYRGRVQKITGHPSGTADILAFVCGSGMGDPPLRLFPLWIELKCISAKQSAEQKVFQQMVEAEGHTYLLIHSAAELEDWLQKNT